MRNVLRAAIAGACLAATVSAPAHADPGDRLTAVCTVTFRFTGGSGPCSVTGTSEGRTWSDAAWWMVFILHCPSATDGVTSSMTGYLHTPSGTTPAMWVRFTATSVGPTWAISAAEEPGGLGMTGVGAAATTRPKGCAPTVNPFVAQIVATN